MASMKLNTDNVRIIMQNLLDDLELWEIEGKEAEKQLAYIAGIRAMANATIEAIKELGGK